MKVAFTTTDRIHINAHFGWAEEIDVYEISDIGYEFVETIQFAADSKKGKSESKKDETEDNGGCKHGKSDCKKNKNGNSEEKVAPKLEAVKGKGKGGSKKDKDGDSEDKTAPKLEALADCTIVYVASIGGVPAAKLIKKGIMPVKAKAETEEIADILNKLVQTLKGNPPPWLRKALQQKSQMVEKFQVAH